MRKVKNRTKTESEISIRVGSREVKPADAKTKLTPQLIKSKIPTRRIPAAPIARRLAFSF